MAREGREEGEAGLAPRILRVNKRQCSERKAHPAVLLSRMQECSRGVKSVLQECQGHKELITRHSRSHFLTTVSRESARALEPALQHASLGDPLGTLRDGRQL